jgi:DmsE family decaheme c-type cytochrome
MKHRLASAVLVGMLWPGALTAQDTAPPDRQGERVAATECARCHDREFQRLRNGAHRDVLHATVLFGCETCHGPGALHSKDKDNDPRLITMPASLADAQQTALCGKCHGDQIRRHGGDPQGFRIAGRSCTDCHSVHGKKEEPLLPGTRMASRAALAEHAENVGTARCVACHPLRDTLLAASAHASLAAAHSDSGCEKCHGAGSLHADAGAGRLITRPDRAEDGVATCRSCHEAVDATEFHWRGRNKPYLSNGVTCTTCHVVHAPKAGALVAADDAATPATNRLCAGCHAGAFATMPGSTHQPLGLLDATLAQGCGSCHAGGEAHARAGGKKDRLAAWQGEAKLQAEVCLSCHQDSRTLEHVRHGDHLRAGVRCTDCHGPLHGARPGDVAAAAEARCASCHAGVVAEFALPNHHPVPEHRMKCTSCHEVHGDRTRPFDLELREQRCVQCHAAYRGPFVFAHQAGRRDGCVVCHAPHGAPTRRLLKQVNTQQNCLQCHGDFPAFHDQTAGAVFTNCIRCHTEVHGSNHSRYLFR